MLTRITRDVWDGEATMCIRCWTGLPRGCDGFSFDGAPLAQSMSKLGICDDCLSSLANATVDALLNST